MGVMAPILPGDMFPVQSMQANPGLRGHVAETFHVPVPSTASLPSLSDTFTPIDLTPL